MSYVIKFVHVCLETLILSVLLLDVLAFDMSAALVNVVAALCLAAALSMPCEMAKELTAIGVILDSLNALAYSTFFAYRRKTHRESVDDVVGWVLVAFFLHASYIWAFIGELRVCHR